MSGTDWNDEFSPCRLPPCSRYDEGEENPRLIATFFYAAGMGNPDMLNDLRAKIARLHDHKGLLFVVYKAPLVPIEQWVLSCAWEEVGAEPKENIEFIAETDSKWISVWDSRRF